MNTLTALNSFIHSRISANLSPETIDWYRRNLQRFFDSYAELPQDPSPIEDFLASVRGCPDSRHGYYRCLKAFYRFLRKRYQVSNPIDLVDPPRRPRKVMATLEPHELMRLLHSTWANLRDRAVVQLFIDTGMRSGELAKMRKCQIKEETVVVNGKTGQHEVPISEETRRLLLTLASQDGSDEYLFHGQRGPLTRRGIYRIVRRYMSKAGIGGPKLGGHRLRHAFGKNYIVNGGDLRSLQEIMGHASITTTQKYATLNLTDTVEKHHRFTPLRAAHAAAQESFFKVEVVKEAEAILEGK